MSRIIAVKPLPDGVNQRGSWQVTVNNRRKTPHTKKSAAKSKARKIALEGDTIEIYGTNGRLQDRSTYRGSRSSGGSSSAGHAWDVGKTKQEYDDLTDLF